MNDECQAPLAEAKMMLADAGRLNASGQHDVAMKLAYEASEFIAAAYLSSTTGESLPPSDATYERFAKTIRTQGHSSEKLTKAREVIGKVSALREIYEPALLDETTAQDAQQMIACVTALRQLVKKIAWQP